MTHDPIAPIGSIDNATALLPPPQTTLPTGPNQNSSIEMSNARFVVEPNYTPSIPTLQPPKKRTLQESFVGAVDTLHNVSVSSLEHDSQQIDVITERMIKAQKNRMDKLMEAAKQAGEKDTWTTLQLIASSLLSAAGIISGIAACSTGIPFGVAAGSMMIAGGVGTLASSWLDYTRHDKALTGALALASAGLSVAGGGMSYYLLAHQMPQLITTIIKSAAGVADGMGTLGKEYKERLISFIEAELAEINRTLTHEELKMQSLGENSKGSVNLIQAEQSAATALGNYMQSIKEINILASQAV